MCGRFTLVSSIDDLMQYFEIERGIDFLGSYNIAPSQNVLVIRNNKHNKREFAMMRWGFVPSWLKEDKIHSKWINARAETADKLFTFRNAFKYRRCLIIADGFYEWHGTKIKKPYYIHMKNGRPFGFAGLWEKWEGSTGKVIESCTILTTDANPLIKTIHYRMPVILQKSEFSDWLNFKVKDASQLQSLLKSYQSNDLEMYEVSSLVNNPRNNSPECILPLTHS